MASNSVKNVAATGKPRHSSTAGLSAAQENRLKRTLRLAAPSEPWVETQIRSVETPDGRGGRTVRRIHDRGAFPPGGGATRMVRCAACRIYTPPQTIEEGKCLDHSDHVGWGPSPSAVAIAKLQYFNLRMVESDLPPDSTAALRKEIAAAIHAKSGDLAKVNMRTMDKMGKEDKLPGSGAS